MNHTESSQSSTDQAAIEPENTGPSDNMEARLQRKERVIRALQESEAHFRQLFEQHSAVMLLVDHQSRVIVDANPAAAQFYGYPLRSLRGMEVSRINSQPESEMNRQRLRAITGAQNKFCFDHRLASGIVRAVEVHISIVNYRGRSLFFSIIHDITDRQRAEAELRIAAVTFESNESMVITDARGVILRVNQAFTENTGYTALDAVGQTPRILKSGRHDAAFYLQMWETIHHTGAWQGEIWDRRKNGEIYPKWLTISAVKDGNGAVTHYVGSHIDITERKASEESIRHLAFYDPLTNLANRRLLMNRLQLALDSCARGTRQGALLFIDLDNFKTLNDTLGHDMGDLLLQQVARRLEACVRDGDTVARLGGDEFVVMLEGLSVQRMDAAIQTAAIGEKILAQLNWPYKLATHEYHSTPSIGATLFGKPDDLMGELMKQADIAMYHAKQAGRNTLRFFDAADEQQRILNPES